MYTIYAGVLIGLIVGICYFNWGRRQEGTRHRVSAFTVLYIGAVGGFVGAVVAHTVIAAQVPLTITVSEPVPLFAVQNDSSSANTFLWGSSSYNFYVLHPDGTYSPGEVWANGLVHISEDPELKDAGYWTTVTEHYDCSSWQADWALDLSYYNKTLEQRFRVPKGSVKHNV
jgi:hypothetical protein